MNDLADAGTQDPRGRATYHPMDRETRDRVERLVDAGLLTERQAEAYVLRRVEGRRRPDAADELEIAVSTLDNYVRTAEAKLDDARETVQALDDMDDDPRADGGPDGASDTEVRDALGDVTEADR